MNVSRPCWAMAMLCCAAPSPAADPTPNEVRAAVARSLPFLEAEGLAWMRERACISCHQIPMLAWTWNESHLRGIAVDGAKRDAWNRWAVDNGLKRAVYYKLNEPELAELEQSGLSPDDVAKLQPLKEKNYVFEHDFREALIEQLGESAAAEQRSTLLKAAAKSKQGGGGGGANNQYAALLLSGAQNEVDDATDVRRTLVAGIVKAQRDAGTWPVGGQLMAQRRSAAEATEDAARWTLLALNQVSDLSPAASSAVSRAEAWLKQAADELPDADVQSIETLLLRLLAARRASESERSRALLDRLLQQQHDDGGWGWVVGAEQSDPFATGQVLYGLHYLGDDAAEAVSARARRYLLDAQADDGAWHISMKSISATKKTETAAGDVVYTYWATGWATVGLLASLPESR